MSINTFLETYKDEHIHITKPVALDHVGALIAQSDETIVFDNIEGYPNFRLMDMEDSV